MAAVIHGCALDYVARIQGDDTELLEASVYNDDNLDLSCRGCVKFPQSAGAEKNPTSRVRRSTVHVGALQFLGGQPQRLGGGGAMAACERVCSGLRSAW